MTDVIAPDHRTHTRTAGQVCAVAGLLGAASGVLLAVVPATVPTDVYSYPFGTGAFTAVQIWFFVQHLGLVVGIAATASAAPGSRLGRVGTAVAVLAMVLLAVTELWAITRAEAAYPSEATAPLDTAYGVASLLTGLGLVLLGIAVVRARRWDGVRRWIPLATGVWTFVPMTPLILSGFLGGRVGITGWMLLFAALGWSLVGEGQADATR